MRKTLLFVAAFLSITTLFAQIPYEETLTLDDYLNNSHNNAYAAVLNPDTHVIYQRSIGLTNML